MITCEVETITRELAEEYLKTDKGNNRSLSMPHVAELVGKQKRGEWVTNGDALRFDTKGQLRDGQHRLKMVEHTGIPIEVVVVRGIESGAFSTMDVGKKRSFSDVLGIEREKYPKQLSLTVQFVWRYLSRNMKGHVGSYEEMQTLLHDHPQIRDSVHFYRGLKQPAGAPGYDGVSMSLHYLFSRVDKQKANDFVSRYITGLYANEATDPIHVTREQIIHFESSPRPPGALQVFSLLVRAFNHYQAEKPLRYRLPLQKVSAIVDAPRIDGFPRDLFFTRPSDMQLMLAIGEPAPEEED
ncbi:MAG: hypothetical protein A2Y91_03285 [Chloroflexi bacterium RBG_13_54_8]|nr:MAG: hypothetical protein A2Y91_03285 [Chloroflexi bacterium RBG_13_54_8]